MKNDLVLKKAPSSIPDMIRYQEADDLLSMEFSYLTNHDSNKPEDDELQKIYEVFSSVAITKNMARSMVMNLYTFLAEDSESDEESD
jgi:hypothetical protein